MVDASGNAAACSRLGLLAGVDVTVVGVTRQVAGPEGPKPFVVDLKGPRGATSCLPAGHRCCRGVTSALKLRLPRLVPRCDRQRGSDTRIERACVGLLP